MSRFLRRAAAGEIGQQRRTSFINGCKLAGTHRPEDFQQLIEGELAEASPSKMGK